MGNCSVSTSEYTSEYSNLPGPCRSCSCYDAEIVSEASSVGINMANLSPLEKAKLAKFDGEVRKAIGALIEAKEETRSLRDDNMLLRVTIATLTEENANMKQHMSKTDMW